MGPVPEERGTEMKEHPKVKFRQMTPADIAGGSSWWNGLPFPHRGRVRPFLMSWFTTSLPLISWR